MQSVSTESHGRALRLPRPSTGVLAGDGGLRKIVTVGRDERLPKARRVESVEEAGNSSTMEDTTMHDAPMQDMWMEPGRPETPVQDADRDKCVYRDKREPPSPDYIRGLLEVHRDIRPWTWNPTSCPPRQVEDINLSSGDGSNFHVHVRATKGLSSAVPLRMPINARNNDDKILPSPPLSPTTASLRERERARAQFVEEAEFEVWSLDPGSPLHLKPRTALGILIRHGLLSETVETGTRGGIQPGGSRISIQCVSEGDDGGGVHGLLHGRDELTRDK
jgi:hypothetical protein